MNIRPELIAKAKQAVSWRRTLHQNPQVGYEEEFASDFIKHKLSEFGLQYTDGWGKKDGKGGYGVVAIIEGKQNTSGKVVALRADMDALKITEQTGLLWSSQNPGFMHACGHDGHTASLLVATQYLAETRNFDGTAVIIFQPAEEGGGGALQMIKEGVLDQHNVDEVYAFHNWPLLPLGQAMVWHDVALAGAKSFNITLTGKGGHGGIDANDKTPTDAAGFILSKITKSKRHGVPSPLSRIIKRIKRDKSKIHANVHGENVPENVIQKYATLEGTMRFFKLSQEQYFTRKLEQAVKSATKEFSVSANIRYPIFYPVSVNNTLCAKFSQEVLNTILGKSNVHVQSDPIPGSEDFAGFLQERPGAMVFIGQADPKDPNAACSQMVHQPTYDFNDNALPVAAAWFVDIIEKRMPLTDLNL
ncbi:MAG: M20 metallopeptidase family protein [Alphaproteobacteria bacterium]